jgi:hypothetical protein
MDTEKSLVKITTKYHCMVSGKKQMEPCEGCSNPKGCLSRAMQYKENEEMDELNEKAIVKIDADGGVVKCAKGLGGDECGYKAGAKVCGACGAMAVMQKDDDISEELDEKADMKPKKPMMDNEMDETEEVVDEAEEASDEMDDDMDDEDEDMEKGWMMKPDKNSRRRAMKGMGKKSGEFDDETFLCQLERKAYPGSSEICEGCTGGCKSEGDLPGLLEIEGTALGLIAGKVLDSGYFFEEDQFVVQIEAKDGRVWEMLADGGNGEIWSVERIGYAEKDIEGKSLEQEETDLSIVSPEDAVEIALKSLSSEFGVTGEVVATESDVFIGHDVYAVEIDAIDGKSYDVYISLDGQFVGLDEWSAEEAEEIEAEAAEIALKRAYSEESRMDMSKRGMALPDGSYPIKDIADLQNAIQAYGRAKDKEAAKAHIMKRARALGAENMIPETWMEKSADEELTFSDEVAEAAELELKAAYDEDALAEMSEKGVAMEDGSFPIKDKTDLMKAIQSYSRAKDKEKAKAHIIKRALDLDAQDMIPSNWVPKEIQDKFRSEEKGEDGSFIASLMEFEMLMQEEDLKDL